MSLTADQISKMNNLHQSASRIARGPNSGTVESHGRFAEAERIMARGVSNLDASDFGRIMDKLVSAIAASRP